MFLDINMFWALLRLILALAKMSLSRAQNIFMPANINSIVILYRAKQNCEILFNNFVKRFLNLLHCV